MGSDPPKHPPPSGGGISGAEEEPLVPFVHLLEKDEGEHGVGAQAGVVGGEALPEAEEPLIPHHLQQHVLRGGGSVSGGTHKILRNLKNYINALLKGWETFLK